MKSKLIGSIKALKWQKRRKLMLSVFLFREKFMRLFCDIIFTAKKKHITAPMMRGGDIYYIGYFKYLFLS